MKKSSTGYELDLPAALWQLRSNTPSLSLNISNLLTKVRARARGEGVRPGSM